MHNTRVKQSSHVFIPSYDSMQYSMQFHAILHAVIAMLPLKITTHEAIGQSKIFLLVLLCLCVCIVVQYLNVYYLRMSIQGPHRQISLNLLQNIMGCSNGKMFMHMGSLFSTFEKSEI